MKFGPLPSSCFHPVALPDLVYAVTPTTSGMMTAEVAGSGPDWSIQVRPACPGSSTDEVACMHGLASVTVTFAGTAGTTYYIAVAGESGAFTLTLSLK
jgi:uncharacterized protein YraI